MSAPQKQLWLPTSWTHDSVSPITLLRTGVRFLLRFAKKWEIVFSDVMTARQSVHGIATRVRQQKRISKPRHNLDSTGLLALFTWTEKEFVEKTEGSAIRRTGYQGWLRNISIALGNADYDPRIVTALRTKVQSVSQMVKNHVNWAITRQLAKKSAQIKKM